MHAKYSYIGWVRVGWRQRCKTRLSLRELGNQGTVVFFSLAVTTAGGRVIDHFCAGTTLTPHKGDDRIA